MKVIRSRNGTTMVEVIAAFAVLILIMGIFSQAMAMTARMMNRADWVLENSREFAGDYYLDKDTLETAEVETGLSFRLSEHSGLKNRQPFSIPAKLRRFSKGEWSIYDVEIP